MFNNEDILTLAKAGFTAQQIAALSQVGENAAPTVTATPPAAPTIPIQGSAIGTAPSPNVPAQPTVSAPATPPAQPTVAPPAQPTVSAPQSQTTAAPHTVDDVLSAITGLSQQMQQNNLLNMTQVQPTQKTATEVLAQIINPPTKKEV